MNNELLIAIGIGLVLLIIAALVFVLIRIKKSNEQKQTALDNSTNILEDMGYCVSLIVYVNKFLFLALNKSQNKLFIVNKPSSITSQLEVEEVLVQFIRNFEFEKNTIILNYYKNGEIKKLVITPTNNEVKNFIHKLFSNSCIKKIKERLPQYNFSLYSSSDFLCNYFWAYSPYKTRFVYLKLDETIKKPLNFPIRNFNILKENFTIDVKYDYFELSIGGIQQQLMLYDSSFLSSLFLSLLESIKEKYSQIKEDMIYYNFLDNVVYLTNSINSLLALRLDDVSEVEYNNNRITFVMKNNQRMVNYISTIELVNEFCDFVAGYNLRKIATNFNYSTDKLINTTPNTKFIVDFSRLRVVYCANVNTLSHFSYIIISFDEIVNVKLEKNVNNIFVRIFLKDNQIIDVSCTKYEVGEYCTALIRKIMDKNY